MQISPTLQCPFHPHTQSLLLLQADGQPALLPSKQRPPMNAGQSFLPSLMLTLPCNILHTSSAALRQDTAKHKWALHLLALRVLSTLLLGLILFMLPYIESDKHLISPLPQCTPHANSLKTFVNTSCIFRTAMYGWCMLLQYTSYLSII